MVSLAIKSFIIGLTLTGALSPHNPTVAPFERNDNYEQYAVVTEVNDQEVIVVNSVGAELAFYGTGYDVDDVVVLEMYNNTTSYTLDDDIIQDAIVIDTTH